jgi:hypothetical protein
LKARVRELAGRLSPALHRTFQLRELDGRSVLETASILNLSKGTVKAHLFTGASKAHEVDATPQIGFLKGIRTQPRSRTVAGQFLTTLLRT